MASSTVPTLKLDGRNWRVYQPNKLSKELPNEEKLEDKLTEVSPQGIKVKEDLPGVPSELHTAQNELHEQPRTRAGKPLRDEHTEVLYDMVEELGKVKNINRKAKEDLPLKPCNRSTMNNFPNMDTPNASSSTTNSQSGYTEELQLTIYDPGGTLEWPTASCQKAKMDEGELAGCVSNITRKSVNGKSMLTMPAGHVNESDSYAKHNIPDMQGVLLEGEWTKHASSDEMNS
ncbi:hypothetical protein EV401DRAFT_1891940 [Pisolithus croceorrhizus]|nr:hypothetical protein EV401DRAFT_1891940 [Pisolithus croceorrhizus]